MQPKLPTAHHPDAEQLARAEARLLAGLSRLQVPVDAPTLTPAQVQWRGPQAAWEAVAASDEASPRYRFGEVFARGGLGSVRRAEDRKLGRTVAIKQLLRQGEAAVDRFVREAEITARLQHPGIVPMYDLGRDADGRPFLCMKLVDGDTLEQAIAACDDLPARLALLPHLISAADAVAYAHRQGIVHRDLKPANILVGEFGETVVIDWGLAKDLSRGTDSEPGAPALPDTVSDLTAAGSLLGTLRYMPPEQARGEPVDARSDVYALGASLHHLLAGAPPFRGHGPAALLHAVLAGAPGPLPAASPRSLVAIAGKAMALAPEDRYVGAGALAEDLRRFAAGRLVGAHDYSLAEVGRLWLRRHRTAAAVACGSLLAMTVLGGVSVARISAARADAEAGRALAVEAGALARSRAETSESARLRAERATDELRLAQARSALTDDPSAAIAWLAQLGAESPHDDAAQTIALAARAHGLPTRTLRGPKHAIERAVMLADGVLVANEEDGPLWRWSPGESRGEIIGPSGQVVVAAGGDPWAVLRSGEIELHRAGQAIARMPVPDGVGHLLADGTKLLVRPTSGDLLEVDLHSGAITPSLAPPALAGVELTPSADGTRLAGARGRTLFIWDRTSREVYTQALPGPAIRGLQISADGRTVAVEIVGSTIAGGLPVAGQILLWRASASRLVTARAVALTNEAAVFAAITSAGTRVWAEDLTTHETRWDRTISAHGDHTTLLQSPDDRLVMLWIGDDEALLDGHTGALLPTPPGDRHWPGRDGVVMTRDGATLQVFDLLHAPWQQLGPAGPSGGTLAVSLSPGGDLLARQRARDGALERVEVARGTVTAMPDGCGDWTREPGLGLHVADDGRVLLTGLNAACLWDARGAREAALASPPASASFTPDGVRLVLHGADNLLEWRTADAAPQVRGATGPSAASVAVDGGRSLAVLGVSGGVRIFDGGWRELLPPDLDRRWPDAGLAVAPDQRTLAVYKRGASELQIVDVIDGHGSALRGATATGPRDPSPRLHFDPSGQHLALVDGGRLTRWSLARPDAPASAEIPGAVAVAFTPDPRRLAVWTREGDLLLVDPEAALTVPLRPRSRAAEAAWLGQDRDGGVLLVTSAGELLRWRDRLPAGAALREWLKNPAGPLGVAR